MRERDCVLSDKLPKYKLQLCCVTWQWVHSCTRKGMGEKIRKLF